MKFKCPECGKGGWRLVNCGDCQKVQLANAFGESEWAPLINRAGDILNRKEMGIMTTMDQMTWAEWKALQILFAEQSSFADEQQKQATAAAMQK